MTGGRSASALALALVVAAHLMCGPAEAAPEASPQVVLDVAPSDSPLVPLLRAELRQLGIEVVERPPEEPLLEAGPSGAVPSVTMHVVLTSESLEVRIVDHATGRTTVRETFPAVTGRAMDPRTAVLHAVELLRWDLRFATSTTVAAAAPTAPVAPEPVERSSLAPAPASNTRIAITPFALYSPGGAGMGLGGQVDVLRQWGRLGARVLGGTVLLPNSLSVPEGTIEVTTRWVGLAGVAIVGGARRTSLELGLGGTVFASTLHGTASGDNVGLDDHVLTFAPFGELRVRRRVTPGFALNLGSAFLVPLQSSRLRVLDREVGRFGQAIVTLGLGAELTLF